MHRPEILFLDEPTEGLDPQSRGALWDELLRINAAGTTMFLTTHYMEEADRLCRRLAIIDDGKIAIEGTPAELKRSVGSDTVSLTLGADDPEALETARTAVRERLQGLGWVTGIESTSDGVDLSVQDAHRAIPEILRLLDGGGIRVSGLSMREPSLDDVFLRYTGKRIRLEEADQPLNLGWY
jgi:ABC-2 type transport system ATP-binding protein